jgi:hypothetical protein
MKYRLPRITQIAQIFKIKLRIKLNHSQLQLAIAKRITTIYFEFVNKSVFICVIRGKMSSERSEKSVAKNIPPQAG